MDGVNLTRGWTSRVPILFLVSLLAASVMMPVHGYVTPLTVTPSVLDLSKGNNATITLHGSISASWAFLLRRRPYDLPLTRSVYDCNTPPSTAATDKRTPLSRNKGSSFFFKISALAPDLYFVCYHNASTTMGNFSVVGRVTVVKSNPCTSGNNNNYRICQVTPSLTSNTHANETLRLVGALAGTRAFLMIRKYMDRTLYNCTKPPALTSNLRTRLQTVGANGAITFKVKDLVPGIYVVCFLNMTAPIMPASAVAQFKPLTQTVIITGPVDVLRSSVCCQGPFTAGRIAYCTISTFDDSGNPTGSADDACKLSVCPLTDGKGSDVTQFVKPYYVAPGQFEFSFVPVGSGCQGSASAAYNGYTLGNKVNFFSVTPGLPVKAAGYSNCSYAKASDTSYCVVTSLDTWGNPAKRCTVSTKGKIVCSMLTS